MNKVFWTRFVALSGAMSVLLGAFAAHGLEGRLSQSYIDTFQTAVLYQFIHTLALFGLILLPSSLLNEKYQRRIASLFCFGIFAFSGSLYFLVLLNLPSLGIITPIGGSAFIIGWIMLFFVTGRGD
tara:strand:- start:354 stop:731 length:378 start_codon:yes stop_codon:yes gene_type:complete